MPQFMKPTHPSVGSRYDQQHWTINARPRRLIAQPPRSPVSPAADGRRWSCRM